MSSLSTLLAAAATLRAALSRFDPAVVAGADCARVAEQLAATEKACAAARTLAAARAVDCGVHRREGFRDGATWLARQAGLTGQQAKRDLETARRLEHCPDTRRALRAGDISMAQATEITQAEADTPGVEATLVPVARTSDLTRLRDQARQQHQAAAPVEELHARQQRARFFRHWRDRAGMVCFAGQLPPATGVAFMARVEAGAAQARRAARRADPDSPPERWEAYAADALTDISGSPAGQRTSGRTELVVVCDLHAWRRGHTHLDEPCHIVGGGPVPVPVAKELSRDAFIKAVLHDGTDIRTVKHFGRHLPAELRTALDLGPVPAFTGRQCAACGARWGLQYDHIDPFHNHGPTSYDNLQPLCWADHQIKTRQDRRDGLLGPRPSNPSNPANPSTPSNSSTSPPRPRGGIATRTAAVGTGMSQGHTITTGPSDAHVEVRLGGELLAATDRALVLRETGLPARYYLPRDDVRMDRLRSTTFHTTCPFKGEASYWSLDLDGQTHDGIVWSYETPLPSVSEIQGMMCFYPDRTELTVDGAPPGD